MVVGVALIGSPASAADEQPDWRDIDKNLVDRGSGEILFQHSDLSIGSDPANSLQYIRDYTLNYADSDSTLTNEKAQDNYTIKLHGPANGNGTVSVIYKSSGLDFTCSNWVCTSTRADGSTLTRDANGITYYLTDSKGVVTTFQNSQGDQPVRGGLPYSGSFALASSIKRPDGYTIFISSHIPQVNR